MKRIASLQALRGFAFLGVFLSHCAIPMFSGTGAWGVSVFLVLSGFVLVYSKLDFYKGVQIFGWRSGIELAKRTIKKLYPLHVIMMLPAIAIKIYEGAMNSSEEAIIFGGEDSTKYFFDTVVGS